MKHDTFIAKCLAGNARLEDIDDYVDAWHDGAGSNRELREFLGMTECEYALWVEQPRFLSAIVAAHRFEFPLDTAVKDLPATPLAARALDPEEAADILSWLQETGRV